MPQDFTLRPIGIIQHAMAQHRRLSAQRPPARPGARLLRCACLPDYTAGLQSLAGFSHLILLYWLAGNEAAQLVFTPPFDTQPRGIFATRGPRRPNPIGLSVVAFDGMDGPTA